MQAQRNKVSSQIPARGFRPLCTKTTFDGMRPEVERTAALDAAPKAGADHQPDQILRSSPVTRSDGGGPLERRNIISTPSFVAFCPDACQSSNGVRYVRELTAAQRAESFDECSCETTRGLKWSALLGSRESSLNPPLLVRSRAHPRAVCSAAAVAARSITLRLRRHMNMPIVASQRLSGTMNAP
jgi:hypothetical protein